MERDKPIRKKTSRKISYIIPNGSPDSHHCGITSLLSLPPAEDSHATPQEPTSRPAPSEYVITGCRDASIRVFSYESRSVKHITTISEHCDWVNDLCLVNDLQCIASCSSDGCVKLFDIGALYGQDRWKTSDLGSVVLSACGHADYVKFVRYSPVGKMVISAGIDQNVLLWDLATGQMRGGLREAGKVGMLATAASIHSMCVDDECKTVAVGSPDRLIRLYDLRSGRKSAVLRGHRDNVRDLCYSTDGNTLWSASSDTTVKSWDFRNCKYMASVAHPESVWCMAGLQHGRHSLKGSPSRQPAAAVGSSYLTGCRDKKVYIFQPRAARTSHPMATVCEMDAPILRLAPSWDGKGVWVCTTSSSLRRFDTTSVHSWALEERAFSKSRRAPLETHEVNPSYILETPPYALPHNVPSTGAQPLVTPGAVLCPLPECTLPGTPAIVSHKLLNNKRWAVTQDETGNVLLWDIVRGVVLKAFGNKIKLAQVVEQINLQVYFPSWCSIDTRLGTLVIHLDASECFNGDVYLYDLATGWETQSMVDQLRSHMAIEVSDSIDPRSDATVNVGKAILECLFANASLTEADLKVSLPENVSIIIWGEPPTSHFLLLQHQRAVQNACRKVVEVDDEEEEELEQEIAREVKHGLQGSVSQRHNSLLQDAVLSSVPHVRVALKDVRAETLKGLPSWVESPPKEKEVKIAFNLEPLDKEFSPATGLSASRSLRIFKIAEWLVKHNKVQLPSQYTAEQYFQFVLNDQPVTDVLLTMGTLDRFSKGKKSPMVMHYRRNQSIPAQPKAKA